MVEVGFKNKMAAWLVFLFILVSVYLIIPFKDFNSIYLTLLTSLLVFVVLLRNAFNGFQVHFARTVLALLFLFSGFVKGVDPIGTQYRIEDYFIAFGTDWAISLALPFSIVLNAIEFVLGGMLLLNLSMRITTRLVIVVMVVFTAITMNDAINNPVPDCGCFGDALIITNWQTLYKNLVIDALLLIVIFGYKQSVSWFKPKIEWSFTAFILIGFIWFQIFNVRHLPVLDFRNWKVGKSMVNENPLPKQFYLTYSNIETGEEREYLSPDYPYNDSAWLAQWEFVSQRVVDPNPLLHDLIVEDEFGDNYTAAFIENPGYQFLIIINDIDKSSLKKIDQIKQFIDQCNMQEISIAIITGSLPEKAHQFQQTYKLDADFYYADDITLKAMIRANPGLLLLKNGLILGKWHYNDWPDLDETLSRFE